MEIMNKQTFTYKTVGSHKILADVYQIPHDTVQPVILRIHGGALIMGNRSMNQEQLDLYLNAGFTVVSFDYRLAPESKIEAIIDDVKDAFG